MGLLIKNAVLLHLILFIRIYPTFESLPTIGVDSINEEKIMKLMVNLMNINLKTNGWYNILIMGCWPDVFYREIKLSKFTVTISNIANEDHEIEDVVGYHSNVVIMHCLNFQEFEESLTKIKDSPYWHPLGHIFILFATYQDDKVKAKIFFILWYYKASYAVIMQYEEKNEFLYVSHYEPYVYENYMLSFMYGCWTAKKIGMPIEGFEDGFFCEEGCHNVSVHSTLRTNNLGTCIGFDTYSIFYNGSNIDEYKFFEHQNKNLHGFPLRAFTTEVIPFLTIHEESNDTYLLKERDGEIWNTMAAIMNFTIDLSPSKSVMKLPFNFELNIQQIFALGQRKADLFLIPIYQMDLIIVELDQTIAFSDGGVCLAAHRAGFETILFDVKLLQNNYKMFIKFSLCFALSWMLFSIFHYAERGYINVDQIGKDFVNCVRNILTISLIKPPKKGSFRIFLCISLWSYFILNFASQAAITSFFTAVKKGKEVETFEDIIEKGHIIEGMASPDVVLPDTEEKFKKINSKLVPITNLFTCIERMKNDSKRFCLIDCTVGRYLERNELNYEGQQYLHIIKDKIHDHYLNMIFPKESPLTEFFNHHMQAIIEGGLIRKWEQYRYSEIKDEMPVKPLGMEDFISIFKCYLMLLAFSFIIFATEIVLGNFKNTI